MNRMKKIIFLLCLSLASQIHSQSPNWVWAQSIHSSNYETALCATPDYFGNIFTGGYFTGSTLTIGSNTHTNPYPGKDDIHLSKYDANGNVRWTKSFGSADHDGLYDIATDSAGNCIIIGAFMGNDITFGTTTLLNTVPGTRDMFLVKLDSLGNTVWAKSYGSTGEEYGMTLDTDSAGNILFVFSFSNNLTIGTQTLTQSTGINCIISKCDPNGTIIWAQTCGSGAFGEGIAVDRNGCAYITGSFLTPTTTFGTLTFTNTSISFGSTDACIVKYDPDGAVIWGLSSSGNYSEEMRAIKVDKSGNAYFTGNFFTSPNVKFGMFYLLTPGIINSFVGKISPSGTVKWINTIKSDTINYTYGLSTGNDGYIYVGGVFDSPITVGTTTLTGTGDKKSYVAKYDTTGAFIWAGSFNGNNTTYVTAVIANNNSEIYVYGSQNCSPGLTLGSTTLSSSGMADVYLAKMNSPAVGIQETEHEEKNIALYPNPNTGTFKLNLEDGIDKGEIILFNSIGQIVFSQKLIRGENEIITEGLATGLYHYSILGNKIQLQAGKIVIE